MTVRKPVTLVVGGTALALAIALAMMPAFALRPVEEGGGADSSAPKDAAAGAPATGAVADHPPPSARPRPNDDEFTPSERIKADSAVSFPVDI